MGDKRLHLSIASSIPGGFGGKAHNKSTLEAMGLAGITSGLDQREGAGSGQALVSLLVMLGALACLVIAFVLLPDPLSALQVFVALGIGLAFISLYLAFTCRVGVGADQMERIGGRIERRLERLQDAQWELSENEMRYRALLDSQEEAIVRRDEAGNLTFANKTFLRMFALTPDEAVGHPFTAEVCGESGAKPLSAMDGIRRQRLVQHVLTANGPRWIEWEEQVVSAPRGNCFEVQSVGRDITDQRHSEMQLAEARDQAEAANRAKSRFLATMSHEIRTPMNGILGMASLLLETQQTAEQQTYVRAIDQSARTLLALIDEILDFSKIEAGKLDLCPAPFAIESCVQGAVELLAPRAHEKGLEIAWSVSPQLPRLLLGDEARVRQILLNLISNAVKFTDAGGVSVRIGGAKGPIGGGIQIEMEVEDTGIGLSQDDMRRLFTEFEQAEAAVRRRNGGTGLGLAISMQLARAMGGEIRVASEPGKGSTFTATLLLQAAANDTKAGDQAVVGEGTRVLLAFDRRLERRALSEALAASGVPVMECDFASADALLEAAWRDGIPFDRLVVDAAEGAEAVGRLLTKARKLHPVAGVRGLVLIDVVARASLAEFRSVGFDGYLVRPVRPSSMMMQLGLRKSTPLAEGEHASLRESGALYRLDVVSRRRVLLAEDNDINALLAKRMLEKCGCEYVAVTNGADAVQLVRQSLEEKGDRFDLILMDIFMPQLDGVEATREIRRLYAASPEAPAGPPIVALTANAFAEDRQRYLEAGMDDYLAKPFDKAGFERVLLRWFGPLPEGDADAA